MHARLGLLMLTLLSLTTYQHSCRLRGNDIPTSLAANCWVTHGDPVQCVPPAHAGCLSPPALALLLPPLWLGHAVAVVGPLLSWGAIAAWLSTQSSAGTPVRVTTASVALLASMGAYLCLVMPVRFTAALLPFGWDPSGHVFVCSLQLVPLWALRRALFGTTESESSDYDSSLAWARFATILSIEGLSLLLWWVAGASTLMHHTGSEVAVVLVAAGALLTGGTSWLMTSLAEDASFDEPSLSTGWMLCVAAWTAGLSLPAAVLLLGIGTLTAGGLAIRICYDVAVAAAMYWLAGRTRHYHSEMHGCTTYDRGTKPPAASSWQDGAPTSSVHV